MTIHPNPLPPIQYRPLDAEWIRLPRPKNLCPITGLSRSALWATVQQLGIKTVALRKPGALKGARLIHRADLLAKLDALATAEPATTNPCPL
jgi:hypothetical protein